MVEISRVSFGERQSQSSDNSWLSSLARKCRGHRTMSRPKGRYEDFLGSIFGHSAAEVFERMYFQEQMSISDIHVWLVDNIGWSVCERQINKIMSDAGIQLRGYVERKRLCWAQGKMDEALAKSREGCKQAYFVGSIVERMVRYLLQVALSALNLPWHVIIGDQLQLILARYEVDIPVVVVNPSTGLSCRFAVEVDTTFVHGSESVQTRDRAKDETLRKSGWTVYRLNGDSVWPVHIVPQVVGIAMDIKRLSGLAFNVGTGGEEEHLQCSTPPSMSTDALSRPPVRRQPSEYISR